MDKIDAERNYEKARFNMERKRSEMEEASEAYYGVLAGIDRIGFTPQADARRSMVAAHNKYCEAIRAFEEANEVLYRYSRSEPATYTGNPDTNCW